ncbi:hypothetical protein [Prevotella sp. KH2C16]|uniref:hypothetical protein n=1 Tax=Prevotella sp. KH2C16 TaxID=1855325 RepID=UPI0008E3ACB5|nr:hypothetical protein [Prevotella sp. KH2C16]SFG56762.1 hypothetical protein SAMN05216383_12068 [Prevotella sp. KH2C16]
MKKSEFVEIERKIKSELENTFMLYNSGKLSKYSFQIFLKGVLEISPKYFLTEEGNLIKLEDFEVEEYKDFVISEIIDDIDNWGNRCMDTINGSNSFIWSFVSDEIFY